MYDAFTLRFQSDLFWLHLKAAFKLHLTSFKALNDGESSCFCVIALNKLCFRVIASNKLFCIACLFDSLAKSFGTNGLSDLSFN